MTAQDWPVERLRALATEVLRLPWFQPPGGKWSLKKMEAYRKSIVYPCVQIWGNGEGPFLQRRRGDYHKDYFHFSPTADDGRLLKWILEESGKWPADWGIVPYSRIGGWNVFHKITGEVFASNPTITEAVMLALEANHGR